MNTMALCLLVTNLLTHPVTLHGCTPLEGAALLECDGRPPIVVTLPPGAWSIDDTDQTYESRTWDDPQGVTMHWQLGTCRA